MADVRLIDANALMKNIGKIPQLRGITYGRMKKAVEETPTIDAVPVVHGRWDETGKVFVHSMYDLFTKCSLCSFGHVRNEYQEPYHYCPNCGAKMDGGADNG